MKKVLFVSHVVRLHMSLFHVPYLKWFHEQGWQVDVASRNDYPDPADCVIPYADHYYDIPFERFPFKRSNLKAYKQLKKLIEKENYDIIHCHTPIGGVLARLAARKAHKNGTVIIYTAHGFHFYKGAPKLNWLLYYPAERLCSRYTDLLLTINREDYENSKKLKAKRVERVNGVGIDLSRFNASNFDNEARQRIRGSLGLKDDDIFAINIGNLIKRKNQITLVNAVYIMNNPRFKLFICGDGEEEQALKRRIDELGISGQVKLLGFRKDVDALLVCADLFLFSSVQEGLAVSVMEAMACGLPVVASDIRGNIDLIDDGKGGYLVNAKNPAEYAEAVGRLLKDPDTCRAMSAYNLEKIKNYSLESVLNSVTELYRDCIIGE